MTQPFDSELDVKGLRCPMPLLKSKQALSSMLTGQVLKVEATDKGALRDIPAFISMSAHSLLKQELEQDVYIFYIQKGA